MPGVRLALPALVLACCGLAAQTITVAAYNVNFAPRDPEGTYRVIRGLGADVLALLEAGPAWERLARAALRNRYPHIVFQQGQVPAAGIGLLSRFPVRLKAWRRPTAGTFPGLQAELTLGGRKVQVLVFHLRPPFLSPDFQFSLLALLRCGADHLAEVRELTRGLERQRPLLILGDANEDETGPAIRWLVSRFAVTDALPLFAPRALTWTLGPIGARVDHVLFSPHFHALGAWTGPAGPSDHKPVVARLRLLPYEPGAVRVLLPGAPPLELIPLPPPPGKGRGILMGKYEVTNAQYAAFVRATGYDGRDHPSSKPTEPFLAHWRNGRPPPELLDYPVCNVNWHHAVAFCRWASRVTGRTVRLPTDAEWTWAAAGPSGRTYPWGNPWDPKRANWGDGGRADGFRGAAPVGSFPAGATPEGIHDLAGNIWEWTAEKSLRGGPWCGPPAWLRVDFIAREDPERGDDKFGFRVVVEP